MKVTGVVYYKGAPLPNEGLDSELDYISEEVGGKWVAQGWTTKEHIRDIVYDFPSVRAFKIFKKDSMSLKGVDRVVKRVKKG